MRKRRRLVNKIMTMSCAVLVAVSAFFYASIESEAKTVWKTAMTNIGNGTPASYELRGMPIYTYSTTYLGGGHSIEGNYDWDYMIQPMSVYDNYSMSWGFPISAWNNNVSVNGQADKAQLKFYVDIVADFDWEGTSSTDLLYERHINITSATISYQGKSYECQAGLLSGNTYRVSFNGVVDVPTGNVSLYGGSIVLTVKGNMSLYVRLRSPNGDIALGEKTFIPYLKCTVGGQGGAYKMQYALADVVDDTVGAIENQTNNLNQATQNQTNSLNQATQNQTNSLNQATQNQTNSLNQATQNQTSELTNGFDNSKGDTVNSDLSAGLNEFQTAEDSLFSTASSSLSDYQFFNLASVPAMVTGMSFVSSILTSWFNQAGGASGVGIVLSILFSIMLVAMVLGLYRWYQSKGGKD